MYIVSSLNEYYMPYTYTMLFSLFSNNPGEHFKVFLIADDLSEYAKKTLHTLATEHSSEIQFLNPDIERIKSALQDRSDWGLETSFRLTLSDLLPSYVDRALYIDGDVIILGDIKEIYNMDFENSDLIAGHDLFSCGDSKQDALAIHDKAFDEIISQNLYFNAGIILYDVNRLREKDMSDRYFEIIDSLDCMLPYPDQDVLNFAHHQHVKYFDTMKYNFQAMLAVSCNGGYDADRIRKEVCIIHYIDKKPWSGGDHIHYDAENIWWDYAFLTPFANDLMEKYIRSSMDGYVHDRVLELKRNNENLQNELQRVSSSVKALLSKLSAT